ncbi:60 kDa neurofilament protein-like [Gigantopelta aegis]|uniref:60 kDa neurofilament protein-like n=1 Tax=Gigantopelta aegis TaxID=1735272 RepID=UPI001B88745E|nr:60 kDa neurofilament protein-like [Gigantopelta aegis]
MSSHSKITEKKTIITTKSSSYADDDDMGESSFHYRSGIGPRSGGMITRTSTTPLKGGSSYVRTMEMSSGGGSGFIDVPGAYSKISGVGVTNVKHTREREKKDMQDLNERFANYIEKVRFLEAQNKKLANELEHMRAKWGKETSAIKQMYETELQEARNLIDETNKEKSRLEIRVSSLQDKLDDLNRQLEEAKKWRSQDRDIIARLNQQIADLESELNMLRRANENYDKERIRDRETIKRLSDEVEKLRIDLNNETLGRMDAENRRQTLEEEIEFLKSVHEQEMKELASLAYRDTTAENREFWKSELSQAIRDIQNEYDAKCDQIKAELDSFYNLKIQEFRTGSTKQNMEVSHAKEETKKYIKQLQDTRARLADLEARNSQLERQYQDLLREMEQKDHDHDLETSHYKEEITQLRAEMESILQELQNLMDAKLSLELEIAAYRKLLEGEETRVGLRQVVEQVMNVQSSATTRLGDYINAAQSGNIEIADSSKLSMKMMRGEVSARTTYQRTAHGPIQIAEVAPDGKYIMLENTSSEDQSVDVNLDGWKLTRNLDGQTIHVYSFRNFTLRAGKTVKIWARGSASMASLNDLVFRDEDSWGSGKKVTTSLMTDRNEEKATHVQRTDYAEHK